MKHTASLSAVRMIALVLCATPQSTFAAQIEDQYDQTMGCDIRVSGNLSEGDAEKLRHHILAGDQSIAKRYGSYLEAGQALIGHRPPQNRRVCFNSNGGSLLEGLKVAEVLVELRKGSAVAPGDVCESACALAFMGGAVKVPDVEGADYSDRVIHPSALLGFHSPSLLVNAGQYNEAGVKAAYEVALKSIGTILEARRKNYSAMVGETDELSSFSYKFPDTLFIEMINTTPDSMRYIQTVGEASQWGITVAPTKLPEKGEVSARTFASVCDNLALLYSESADTFYQTPPFLEAVDGKLTGFTTSEVSSEFRARIGPRNAGIKVTADMGPYWFDCEIGAFTVAEFGAFKRPTTLFDPWGYAEFGQGTEIYAFQLFEPKTEIASLKPSSNDQAFPSGTIDSLTAIMPNINRTDAEPTSCWLASENARITNVSQFVNIRRQPDINAPIVREAPLGDLVRILRTDSLTFLGVSARRQACFEACMDFLNSTDAASVVQSQSCINDNVLWYEIIDARGNRGWVSRKFLEEVE